MPDKIKMVLVRLAKHFTYETCHGTDGERLRRDTSFDVDVFRQGWRKFASYSWNL